MSPQGFILTISYQSTDLQDKMKPSFLPYNGCHKGIANGEAKKR